MKIMGVAPVRRDAEVDVVTMSATEYKKATDKALRKLGLTYAKLAEQARQADFSSFQAEKLWMAIGGDGR